jgi:hypothetical protein
VSDLRPFTGQLRRWPPVLELDAGTWQGAAKVTPITGGRGADTEHRRFEVAVSWHGPGLEGLPPVDGPVDATDLLLVGELELAKAIATAAIDELKALRAPDLRALERRLRSAK